MPPTLSTGRTSDLEDLQLTAVTYQRVSTEEQASKGGRSEGFSIPAQRQANQHKADELGAKIVAEFVDPGYTGRTLKRPDLQRMLQYIKSHQVTYCIVHKLDRLARDRLVDLEIQRALIEAGVTLVSVTESIDETPSGTLVHGVMSAIAEFYSKNLAAEVTKGLTQKIATGGTPGRAPLGYLNVRKHTEEGREYRTVEVDPERAPLIQWAFATYAAGDTSVEKILTNLTARGLTTVATPQRPSKPVSKSGFFKLLRNPYYIGRIRYNGAVHDGNHPPIIDTEIWERVQRLLDSRAQADVRYRKHEHPLKGILYCATCKSRLHLDFARNKQGIRYAYYVCSGRTSKRTTCTRKAVPVGVAEDLVQTCYQRVGISETAYTALAKQVDAAFDERMASRSQELAELTANRKRLQAESEKLLAAHFADAIDLETLKRHQDRIRTGLAEIDRKLEADHDQYTGQRKYLASALKLLTYCATMYRQSDDEAKRLANQAFFDKIYIGEDEQPIVELAEPFNALAPDTFSHVGGSSTSTTVELRGIEPLTFSLRTRRSTN
jgi:site-specific DNA recombinase